VAVNPQQLLAHASRLRSTLSTGQLASLAAAFIAVVGVLVGSAYWASTPSYTVLYRDLDPESANAVVAKLKAANTAYRLNDNGTTLLVPASRVDELRLDFAAQGLPTAGRIGFEIFDRTTFGTTEFLEHVNYRRGLEGELARTIATIGGVASARVHIALAKDSLFTASAEQAKASVVLKLRNAKPLAPSTVAGIAGLVASAVESLRPESVVIVDTFGRPLSKPVDDALAPGVPAERQQQFERDLMTKVVTLLEPVVGPGRVRVNVSARFSATSAEETEESWDPNAVVRSQQKSSDTSTSVMNASKQAGGGAVAGARANQPPEASTANPQALQVSGAEGTNGRISETTNYEIGKKTRHTIEPGGQIERLSVAVIVDDVRTPGAEGQPSATKPREAAEMERIKGLVAASVGLDSDRGDQLTVENIAFEEPAEPVEVPGAWWQQVAPTVQTTLGVQVGDLLRWALVGFLSLVALFAVIRPLAKAALGPVPRAAALPQVAAAGAAPVIGGPKTVAELEGEMQAALDGRPARMSLAKSIAAKAESEPEQVAQLVRAMLAQGDR
jgi:flagellar M-ring protein FliF